MHKKFRQTTISRGLNRENVSRHRRKGNIYSGKSNRLIFVYFSKERTYA